MPPTKPTTKPVLQPGKVNLPLPTVKTTAPRRFTSFVYGYSGAGKSYMLRSLLSDSALFPALVLVCDSGHATYIDLSNDDTFQIVETPTIENVIEIINWLGTNSHPFKTLAIDNVTELHRTALNEAASRRVNDKGRGTTYRLEQSDYGEARNQILSSLATVAMQMPRLNFITTALAYDVADEMTGLSYVQPNLAGKLATEIPGFFDICGYLYTKSPTASERRQAEREGKKLQSHRILVTAQTQTIVQARNRGGKLNEQVIDPTWPKIYKLFTS